jgi:hypothetical protein
MSSAMLCFNIPENAGKTILPDQSLASRFKNIECRFDKRIDFGAITAIL